MPNNDDPLRFSPKDLVEQIRLRGEDWADKNSAAEMLEETKSIVLAQQAVKFMGNGDSAAKADAQARASDLYKEHVLKMVEARRDANKARVRYDAGKVYAELLRTKAATERSQMELGKGT